MQTMKHMYLYIFFGRETRDVSSLVLLDALVQALRRISNSTSISTISYHSRSMLRVPSGWSGGVKRWIVTHKQCLYHHCLEN